MFPEKRYFSGSVIAYHQTPIHEITNHPACMKSGVRLFVKREDLNHPVVSGNKWWKLRYNLEAAIKHPSGRVLTFGGAFSNHVCATAAAAREFGLDSIGIIRGEKTLPLNRTLESSVSMGMKLHYVSRSEYRQKSTPEFIETLRRKFGDFYLIPEGGTNSLAVKGCAEFAREHLSRLEVDHLLLPVGTGGTIAGIICGLQGQKSIRGISVLKDGAFLSDDIKRMVSEFSGTSFDNWSILTQYHEGGYARTTPRLRAIIAEMRKSCDLPLDHVYTGKLMMAAVHEIEAGAFGRGARILVLHTGGLQGAVPD